MGEFLPAVPYALGQLYLLRVLALVCRRRDRLASTQRCGRRATVGKPRLVALADELRVVAGSVESRLLGLQVLRERRRDTPCSGSCQQPVDAAD